MRILKVFLVDFGQGLSLSAAVLFPRFELRRTVRRETGYRCESGTESIRTVQISDFLIKPDAASEDLRKIIHGTRKQDPDFVMFTGNRRDHYAAFREDENVVSQLDRIQAKYGEIETMTEEWSDNRKR